MGRSSKKMSILPIEIVAAVTIGLVAAVMLIGCFLIWQDRSYVRLIDAIGENDNEKVEELLKRPYFTLDKVSGHIPYRWIPEMGERNSPLEQACQCGNYEAAKMLIEKGADASIVQDGHFSLLYLAMEETDKDDYKLVKLLVENGADPKGCPDENYDGESSLVRCASMDCGDYHFNSYTQKYTGIDYDKEAAYRQHYDKNRAKMILEIYKYLEKTTESPVVKDNLGIDPLDIAVGVQNIELIKYLLEERRYEINGKDSWGETSIFSIYETNNTEYDREWKAETLKLLIANGADPNVKDNEGKTTCDYAIEFGDEYLAGLLKPYMNR